MPEPAMAILDIVKTVKAEKKGKNLLKMEIGRDDNGIVVNLQSDIEWVGALRDKRQTAPQFVVGGVHCFQAKAVQLDQAVIINQPDIMSHNGAPNMTILMARGLQAGVKFSFQQPMSADKLREWAKSVRSAATELYNCYLRPVDIQMTVTVESKENSTLG